MDRTARERPRFRTQLKLGVFIGLLRTYHRVVDRILRHPAGERYRAEGPMLNQNSGFIQIGAEPA
jgi:hypothetical protein